MEDLPVPADVPVKTMSEGGAKSQLDERALVAKLEAKQAAKAEQAAEAAEPVEQPKTVENTQESDSDTDQLTADQLQSALSNPNEVQSEKPAETPQKKIEAKIDGETVELTPDELKAQIAEYQKYGTADKRLKEVSEQRKELAQLKQQLQYEKQQLEQLNNAQDPWAVFEARGIDPVQAAYQRLQQYQAEQQRLEQMTPQELQAYYQQQAYEQLEAQQAEKDREAQQAEYQQQVEQEQQRWAQEIADSLELVGLPSKGDDGQPSRFTARMAMTLQQYMMSDPDFELPLEDVANSVVNDIDGDVALRLESLPADEIDKRWGSLIDKVVRYRIDQSKAVKSRKVSAPPKDKAPATKSTNTKGAYSSGSAFIQAMEDKAKRL